MMGDYEEVGDDLIDTDSFVNHRGAGEEPFFVPEENESDSSPEDNDVVVIALWFLCLITVCIFLYMHVIHFPNDVEDIKLYKEPI